jgi:hypothetical protein
LHADFVRTQFFSSLKRHSDAQISLLEPREARRRRRQTKMESSEALPASLSQEVGLGLGAQAGEARLRDVITAGGFTRFRRATETPFNVAFEARP